MLKPGAHLLAFGGTRTYHRLVSAIEDAGFEIRDCIAWMYGSGFPKSLDISKAIDASNGDEREVVSETVSRFTAGNPEASSKNRAQRRKRGKIIKRVTSAASAASAAWVGYGTALKPAFEPCVVARKPLDGTVAQTAQRWGTGGLAIDTGRIRYAGQEDQAAAAAAAQRFVQDQNANRTAYCQFNDGAGSLQSYLDRQDLGRWPANVTLSHSDGCRRIGSKRVRTGPARKTNGSGKNFGSGTTKPALPDAGYASADGTEEIAKWRCVGGCPVKLLDEQAGDRPGMSGGGSHREDYGGGMFGGIDSVGTARNDNGGPSRLYYSTKASRQEREFGCEALPSRAGYESVDREEGSAGLTPRAGAGRTSDRVRNHHPTVKPIALNKYLASLILPPAHCAPRRIIVPFSGSGSEILGAIRAGWDEVVGIEREPDFAAIARARIERWSQVREDLDESEAVAAAEKPDERQASLFGAKAGA